MQHFIISNPQKILLLW